MKFNRIQDDINFPNRWYLGDIIGVDNWAFTSKKVNVQLFKDLNLTVEVYKDGNPMDFTLTEAYAVPIISERLKTKLSTNDNLYFLPVTVLNKVVKSKYYILIIKDFIDCVDEEKSDFTKFIKNDNIRPDLAGEYSAFFKLIINPFKTEESDFFRLENFELGIIINQLLKDKIKNCTGITYEEV